MAPSPLWSFPNILRPEPLVSPPYNLPSLPPPPPKVTLVLVVAPDHRGEEGAALPFGIRGKMLSSHWA